MMGFPVGYTELFYPKIFVFSLSILGFIRNLILSLFRLLGLSEFLETDNIWPENPTHPPISAALTRDFLPAVKYGGGGPPESCAVCLHEFEEETEIRRLKNCKHIFHRGCLDTWMDHGRDTCPLCRASLVPDEMREEFDQRLWAYSEDSDFYSEYSSVPVV